MVKAYGEKAMDIAHRHRAMGIREFFALCAAPRAAALPPWSAGPNDYIRAAFSTVSLPGILSNIANKVMLDRYNNVDRAWMKFCKKGVLNDFKPHFRYRMTEDFKFKPVGPDGQLQNVQLGEQAFQIQAATEGATITLSRQMIVNDDMSAFADMPSRFGIGRAKASRRRCILRCSVTPAPSRMRRPTRRRRRCRSSPRPTRTICPARALSSASRASRPCTTSSSCRPSPTAGR